jgi:FixJ family two-component response regulator
MNEEPLVLVVDDDESVRRATRRLFASVGLEVLTFASAEALLEHDWADRPTCLVLDVRMPGVGGLDLQQTLAQAGVEVPIIFITGHGDVPMSVRAMKAGACDFLEKPFNDQVLLDSVQRALNQDRERLASQSRTDGIRQRLETLTRRERQVFELVVAGLLNKQIASRLGAAEKTVKIHRGRVMEKMQASSLAELLRAAAKVGLLDQD